MANKPDWAIGKMVGKEFKLNCYVKESSSHYYIFTEEHKAWEFINTKIVEEHRGDYTVRPVNVIAALKNGTYVES